MSFDHDVYLRSNFYVPVFVLLFYLFWMVPLIKSLICKIKKHETLTENFLAMVFVGACITFLMFSYSINSLKNGGIHLIYEDRDYTITETCTIENIDAPSELYPYFKYDHKAGADISANGKTYFAVEAGDFKEGDLVTITYYPKSKVIVSIYYADEAEK